VALRLHNGTEVTIRPIRPDDKALLAAAVERLSPRSARMRFLAPKTRLTTAEQRYLTEIDFVDHYALVAILTDDDPRPLVGVGRWVRDADDPQAAEIALLVSDRFQRQGLGIALGKALKDAARARGIRRFTGVTLTENEAALRLLAHLSNCLRTRVEGATYELVADLAA
jgi:RimJ/RimL family protein N-acetyltransferase